MMTETEFGQFNSHIKKEVIKMLVHISLENGTSIETNISEKQLIELFRAVINRKQERIAIEKAIQIKRKRKTVRRKNTYKRWTPDEDQLLLNMKSSNISYKEMARKLGRSIQSVTNRIYMLKH